MPPRRHSLFVQPRTACGVAYSQKAASQGAARRQELLQLAKEPRLGRLDLAIGSRYRKRGRKSPFPLSRIGQRCRETRIDECADQDDALHLAAETIELRMRHGYTAKRTIPAGVRDAIDAGNAASEE